MPGPHLRHHSGRGLVLAAVGRATAPLSGDRATTSSLYSCLTTACTGIEVHDSTDRPVDRLPPRSLGPFGLRADWSILPSGRFPPLLRLLEELFWLPEALWGVSIFGNRRSDIGEPGVDFSLAFDLERLPEELAQLSCEEFLLRAVPALGARHSHQLRRAHLSLPGGRARLRSLDSLRVPRSSLSSEPAEEGWGSPPNVGPEGRLSLGAAQVFEQFLRVRRRHRGTR